MHRKQREDRGSQPKTNPSQQKGPFRPVFETLGVVSLAFGGMCTGSSHNVISFWLYALGIILVAFGIKPLPKFAAFATSLLSVLVAGLLTFETLRSAKSVAAKEQTVSQPAAQPEKQSVFVKSATMEPLVPGKPPVAKIAIKNGRGETTLVFSKVTFFLSHLVPERYLKYQESPTQTFVFGDQQASMAEWTGNQAVLSQDDINDLNADPPMAELYVFAKGQYSTDAGQRRLDVCRKYYKPSAPELSFCADDLKIE